MVWRACARQGQVALTLDDHRVALATFVVELHVAHLVFLDELSVASSSSRIGLAGERRRARTAAASSAQ